MARRVRPFALLAASALVGVVGCGPRVTMLDRADSAYTAGEWIQAESLYRRALRERPGHGHAQSRLARLAARDAQRHWEREEDDARALELITGALSLDAQCVPAMLLRTRIALAKEQLTPQEAVSQLEALAVQAPEDAEVRLVLGGVLLDLERAPAAVEHFHLGSRAAPGDLRFPVLLAEALHALNPEEARGRMDGLLQAHPGDLTVLAGAARLAMRAGRFEDARRLLGDAQRADPSDYRIRQALRRLERRRSEWDVQLDDSAAEAP